jgi:hypothetical protein
MFEKPRSSSSEDERGIVEKGLDIANKAKELMEDPEEQKRREEKEQERIRDEKK